MANRTIQFDIKAFADTKGLDEFASELKRLRGQVEPVDRILGEAVKQVNEYAKSQKVSADNTALAVGAINALKGAMTAGSSVWRSAGADVKAYQNQIKALTSEYDRLAAAETASARRARKIQAIQEYEGTANFANRTRFQGIPLEERTPQSTRGPGGTFVAPPGVSFDLSAQVDPAYVRDEIAAVQAAEAQYRQAYERHRQQLLETQARYDNLELEKEREQQQKEDAQRKRDLQAGKENFERELERRQNAKARQYAFPIGPAAPSELFQSIGGIGVAGNTANLQLMGRSYREVAAQIRETSNAAGGSTAALQAERRAWEQLRGAITPATREYRQATREIERIDRRTGDRNHFGRFGESAGAIAAGGFFGGPEGLAGSIIGTAVGGPSAALGGATIGASVGIVRQQLGGFATYAADLAKLEIGLKGVTKSAEDYQFALAAIQKTSNDFNVPIGEATKNFTRLTASVIGAGGSVAQAETVFRNVTAAIKATGGSAQDVDAALLAMSQVFSKGKVSAEELSGQLGERLAGAVVLFAKATGRSTVQLADDLKKGTVGLNDLLKFTESLGPKYENIAKKIAASTEDAGARAQLATDQFRRMAGEALIPVGAAAQQLQVDFLKAFGPSIVEAIKASALGIQAIGEAMKLLNGPVGVVIRDILIYKGALLAVTAIGPRLAAFHAATTAGIAALGGSAATTATRVAVLTGALKSLLRFAVIGIAIEIGINGIEKLITLNQQLNQIGTTGTEAYKKALGGAAQNQGKLNEELQKNLEIQAQIKKEQSEIKFPLLTGRDEVLRARLLEQQTREAAIRSMLEKAPEKTPSPFSPSFGDPSKDRPDSDAAARKAANEAAAKERLAMQLYNDQLRLEERLTQNRIKLEDAVFRHRMELMRKAADNQRELDDKRMSNLLGRMTGDTSGAAAVVDLVRGLQELDRRKVDAQQAVLQSQRDLASARQSAVATARTESLLRSDDGSAAGGKSLGYITANQMRAWLKSQGYERTSGDFTNKGHRTHNHMLNAIDIGELDGSYSYAVQRAKQLEARLRATGAFGNQLFGPTSDPRGHKDHVHIPTPGGRIVLTPALAQLMGLTGGTTRTLANGKTTRIPGLASAAGRNVNDDGSVATSEADVAQQRELLRLETERAKLLRPEIIAEFTNKISGGLREQQKALEDSNAEFQLRNRLTMEGMRPDQIDFEVNKTRILRDSNKAVSQANEVLEQLKDRISPEVYKEAKDAIEQLGQGYQKLAADTEAAYKAQNAPGVKLNRRRGELRQALGELGEAENAIVSLSDSVENGLSNGFSQAVTNIVSGTGTIKDAIANMLQSIAQEFLNYAAKILAKQAVLGILGLFGRGLGGAVGGGAGGFASVFAGSSDFSAGFGMTGSLLNANGNAFANGIRPFSSGGVVDRPTLFRFANGGAMSTGVMGEAGPEAILPLRRGPNGKLGVQAAPPAPIDVRVETTVINGVEYATVDQLRQATKEAAERGRNMAYAGIQQSVKVRRRLGVG